MILCTHETVAMCEEYRANQRKRKAEARRKKVG